jgi:ABC-type sulfate/molybdate transport systems ATPase subunit
MVLVSHDPADAALFGEHVVRLRDGEPEDGAAELVEDASDCYDLSLPPRPSVALR